MKEQKPDVSSSQEAPQDLGSQETPLKRTDGKIQVTIAFHDQKTKLLMNPTTQFSKVFAKFYAATNAQAGTYKFIYNGIRIEPTSKPLDIEMGDEDDPEIMAVLEQVGGSV
ncbi:hypothetical protein AURDEDRAFT_178043 [Auricularia subglabra TFB-10046 SS5]|uniref:Rad60/SUMO-like domain-containing protein n=1 Tax=Auricularia subglabra (strain TFB-10046 / SS5) TaxID=717982 RepID=J0L910_AURST|nr:hypothetical protein AURDEDRAFT_178043 [Auricularia subglabra TFB-10046 SS5]